MNLKTSLLVFNIICIALLPGCIKKPTYKPQKLHLITKRMSDFQEVKNNVTVRAKKLQPIELTKIFGLGSQELSSKFETVQLSIENQSKTNWELSSETIDIPQEQNEEIAQLLKYHATSRWLGYSTIGAACAGTSLVSIPFFVFGAACGLWPIAIPAGAIALSCGLGAGLASIEGSEQYNSSININERIDKDIFEKILDSVIISQYKFINKLLFIKKSDYKKRFTLTLIPDSGEEKKPLIFNINLR